MGAFFLIKNLNEDLSNLFIFEIYIKYQPMTVNELKSKVSEIIRDLKDNGIFPKENNTIDYKLKLNIDANKVAIENFIINFAKDILSFSNADGGIILIGISENKTTGKYEDTGLDTENLNILNEIDLNLVSQKFEKITKTGVTVDLQHFKVSTRDFYYLLIEKQNNVLIPINDFKDYKISKGDIYYRASSKNELANINTSEFNRFLQIKANEKSKEFMDIWSKLLPEMFDINPREVLILNPKSNRVYGFNAKENILSSSEIEIDQDDNGVFNIILNAISAGEIGKISNDEGKPIYKIVGELKSKVPRDFVYLTSVYDKVKERAIYNITANHLKQVFKYLEWVTDPKFSIENPKKDILNEKFSDFLWLESLDKTVKVVFSKECVEILVKHINDKTLHITIFGKELHPINEKSRKRVA